MVDRLEAKIIALTADLENETRSKNGYFTNLKLAERKVNEMEFQLEEERKNTARLQVCGIRCYKIPFQLLISIPGTSITEC